MRAILPLRPAPGASWKQAVTWLALATMPVLAQSGPPAGGGHGVVFGPKDVTVVTGQSGEQRFIFGGDPTAGHLLCVDNRGTLDHYHPVTSAWIVLNGSAIFRPNDFNPRVGELGRPVIVQEVNELSVTLNGRPGSGLSIWVARGTSCSPSNAAPFAEAGLDREVTVGATVTLDGTASSDPDGDPLTYAWTLQQRPAGSAAALDAPGSAHPSFVADVAGSYVAELIVHDGSAASVPDRVTITAGGSPVNRPPAITSAPVTTATLFEAYTYAVVASDPDGDPLTYTLTAAPPGMAVDGSAGLISWLPTGTGIVAVAVNVSDGHGGQAAQSFSLNITVAANRPPELRPVPDRQIPVGVPFRMQLIADDPDPDDALTFALVGGPTGATLGPSPLLEWTPATSQLGRHVLTARVQDRAGASDTMALALDVVDSPAAPRFGPQEDATVLLGSTFARVVEVSDPNPADSRTLAVVAGPAGLVLDVSGQITWTPTSAHLGAHAVTLSVTDSTGLADMATFTLFVDVAQVAAPPVARDDRYAARRNAVLSVLSPGVADNDFDPAGLGLAAAVVTPPAKGALTLLPGGGFDYTPAPGAPGSTEPALVRSRTNPLAATTRNQPVVGDVDGDGVPEVVIVESGPLYRRLVAVRGSDMATVFDVDVYRPNDPVPVVIPLDTDLALGDLDGDGRLETVAVGGDLPLRRTLLAFNHDGTLRWTSDDLVDGLEVLETSGAVKPVLADLDHDGRPEIIVAHAGRWAATPTGAFAEDGVTVFDADGHRLWTTRAPGPAGRQPTMGNLVVADLDLDGCAEIVVGEDVFDCAGAHRWSNTSTSGAVYDVAVVNLDDDPFGEVLFMNRYHWLYATEHTGAAKWSRAIQSNGFSGSGITVGDADGDGVSEILIVRESIEVLNRDGSLVRTMSLPVPEQQVWGQGGNPTVFDLNGDGRPEVIFHGAVGPFDDALRRGALYIFDGPSGALLHTIQATRTINFRHQHQTPVVADVDGDGAADIATGGWDDQMTLRVFSAAQGSWARTRPIWNQTSYHATNVEADGRIPPFEAANWLTPGLNSQRVNVPLPGETSSDIDRFTYRVSNGQAMSNVATVQIDLLPASTAPRIVSIAPATAAPGVPYVYGVSAMDPDAGEALSFALVQGPADMTITSGSGVVRWTPPAAATGVAQVIVQVTDASGQSDTQMFFVSLTAAIAVPDATGLSEADAAVLLQASGLSVGSTIRSPNSVVPEGHVVSHEPSAGTLAATGSDVALVISSGPVPVTVPNLVGDTERSARQRLTMRGFSPVVVRAFSSTVPDGVVISQSPMAGTTMAPAAVTVTVSVGSGLRLRLPRATMPAGTTMPVTVVAYGLNYEEVVPPAVGFEVTAAMSPSFGSLPAAGTGVIATGFDTRGAFRVTATDAATGRTASADFAVTHPRPASGTSSMNDVIAGLTEALGDIDELIRQGRVALAAEDDAAMRVLLQQMVTRWRQVDVRELSLATPLGLELGFFPTLGDLAMLGLSPTADDLLAQTVLTDAAADLRDWIQGLRADDTSMAQLQALARRFRSRAARLNGLTLSEWGVIRAQSAITVLVSDRLPRLYDALMADLERVLETPSPAGPAGAPGLAGTTSTLGEQLTRMAMEYVVEEILEGASEYYRSAKQVMGDTLKFAAFGAATVAAAHHFREFVQAEDLTAVVAGASLSFRFFEKEFSFIEAAIDPEDAGGNVVIAIGPDLMQPVTDFVERIQDVWKYRRPLNPTDPADGKARSADDLFTALKGLYDALTSLGESTVELSDTIRNAFQPEAEVIRGCVFTTAPNCGQLFYRDGLASVYHYNPPPTPGLEDFKGFPVPVLFMVYNVTTGGMSIDTPAFFPTTGQ